jgi:hypothetical protein
MTYYFHATVQRSVYFLLNSKTGRATLAAKYGKVRKGQKSCKFQKFTKKVEVLKDLIHPRWRPWLPQALAVVASLAFLAFAVYCQFVAILAKCMITERKKIYDITTKMIVKAGKPLVDDFFYQ